jgi:aminopeptidase N
VARVTGRPLDRILKSYVEQPGAPVISVQTKCTGTNSEITLSQERFIGIPGASPPRQTWTVPVCFKTADGQLRCEAADRPTQTFTGVGCANVFANADGRGYYFTEYAPAAVRSLSASVGGLKPVERISLLGDEWWMVRSGRHDIGVYLDLAATLSNDETAAVTDAIASRLAFTHENLVTAAERPQFQTWIRDRFGPALAALGLPGPAGDTDERHSRRAELLALVALGGNDAAVQSKARELALAYIDNPASLPGTLAPAVLRVAAASGDVDLYERYRSQLDKSAGQPEEYYRFFTALSSFGDPALAQRTLEFAISPEVRTQDTGTLIAGLLANPRTRDAAWAFVQARWTTLTEKLGTFQGIPGIIGALGSFCATDAAAQVKTFFTKHTIPSAERTLQQSIERIENCAALAMRQAPALKTWLAAGR